MNTFPVLRACAAAALALCGAPQVALSQTAAAGTTAPAAAPVAASSASAPTMASPAAAAANQSVVIAAKRAQRSSKGATGLPLSLKDTPQSIGVIDREDMENFGLSGANDALILGTGVNVEQYETNRATINSRGFDIQSTQVDGLGMTNSWGTVVGQQDIYLFDKIEVIRGANGLLTGVGNASGTINYVRKRPTGQNTGELGLSLGSWGRKRATLDLNRRLSEDGRWAGRLVVAHQESDSYLRGLHEKRTSVYGVIDGQVSDNGTLTLGLSNQEGRQRGNTWGNLTLNYIAGGQADFDVSSSTAQDWTRWNTRTTTAFAEYTHTLSQDWEFKASFNLRQTAESTRLLYAYTNGGGLNADNTGLVGWAYASQTPTDSEILDLQLSGRFQALGRQHDLLLGLSHGTDEFFTDIYPVVSSNCHFQALPAFPYAGNACSEPVWGAAEPSSSGKQALTRLYAATRLHLAEGLHAVVGLNAVRLQREGSSMYGNAPATVYPDTRKVSPYAGLTYAVTRDINLYASYSDIFQNQEQVDINSQYLAPTQGKNHEFGIKAEWLDKQLLTTLAVYGARQNGLAHEAGVLPSGTWYYEPGDVKSKGWEFEATGRLGPNTRLSAGISRVSLTDPSGLNSYPYVPKTTANLRAESALPMLPALKLGASVRWQDDVANTSGVRQDAYALASAFARYEFSSQTSVRLTVSNLTDQKYLRSLQYGAIYGAPRSVELGLNHKF